MNLITLKLGKLNLTCIIYPKVYCFLGLIVILAPCIHGVKYQGSAILQDLTEVALRLMTPTGTSFDWTKRNFLKSQKYNPGHSIYKYSKFLATVV